MSTDRANRRVLAVTCRSHPGPAGYANLVVSKEPDGVVVLDPHAAGACVIAIGPGAARELHALLGRWFG